MKKTGTVLFFVFVFGAVLAGGGCGRGPRGTEGVGPATGAAAGTAETGGTQFGYPVAGEPWYFVRFPLAVTPVPQGLEEAAWSVDRVEVDGTRVRDFLVYQGGREIDKLAVKAKGGRIELAVKARWVWQPKATTEMKVQLVEPKSGDIQVLTASGTAPAGKGYWDPAWKDYASLVISEESGFARKAYPVHATLGILANYMTSPDEVRVVVGAKSGEDVVYHDVPCQVYDVVTWNDPKILSAEEKDAKTGEKVVRYHPTTSFGVAFLADVAAGELPAAVSGLAGDYLQQERNRGHRPAG